MEEVWKDIVNFSRYQISNLGRVKSKKITYSDSRGRVFNRGEMYFNLKPYILKTGRCDYIKVKLIDDFGKIKNVGVHRLVAIAFIPNPNNLPEVNHIDSNRTNNVVTNLEWVTKEENMAKAIVPGHNGSKNGNSKLTEDDVKEICKLILAGKTDREIAKMYNLSSSNVILFIRKKEHWKSVPEVMQLPDYETNLKVRSREDVELVCKLIKEGKTTKEICEINSSLSKAFVNHIRRKDRFTYLKCVQDL